MEDFEKFKRSLQCRLCEIQFHNDDYQFMCITCNNSYMCENCYNDGEETCTTCLDTAYWEPQIFEFDIKKFIQSIDKFMDTSSKRSTEVEQENEKLKTENSLVKEEKEKFEKANLFLKRKQEEYELSREDHHKCTECTASESEQNMQLCTTCHEMESPNVVEHVLCSSCAIKKHIRKGHQTVDFYPYLRAAKYNSHSAEVTSASESLQNSRDLLNITVKKFNHLSKNASEKFTVLTDMARRSNSTKNQVEFFDKIKVFVNESNLIHVDTDNDLKTRIGVLEKNLANIKEWYEEQAGNCVDEDEVVNLPTDVVETRTNRARKRKNN